ncbi:MAG TPA: hypothetical protein VEC60_14190 [Reyranella sp.]|nr:hypothetical protein [Reyranella sp.]
MIRVRAASLLLLVAAAITTGSGEARSHDERCPVAFASPPPDRHCTLQTFYLCRDDDGE